MAEESEEKMIECGTGDAFHDLGLPEADELLAKAKLARAIVSSIKERKLSQHELARLTGIDRSSISALLHGKIALLTSDELMGILNKLHQDVVIFIRPRFAAENRVASVSVERVQGP